MSCCLRQRWNHLLSEKPTPQRRVVAIANRLIADRLTLQIASDLQYCRSLAICMQIASDLQACRSLNEIADRYSDLQCRIADRYSDLSDLQLQIA